MKATRDEMRSAMDDMERIWAKPEKEITVAIKEHKYPEFKPVKNKGKGKK